MRDVILGAGSADLIITDAIPSNLYSVDPESMGMNMSIWSESLIPAKKQNGVLINIVDSSGSMGKTEIGESLAVCYKLLSDTEDEGECAKVYFMSADTQLRGDFIEMTRDNVEELTQNMPIYGRGGTDITVPIRQAIEWAMEKELRIDGIIYSTDMDVPPPRRDHLPEMIPPIVIIGVNDNAEIIKSRAAEWNKACSTFAKVTYFDITEEIDFAKLSEELKCEDYLNATEGFNLSM